MIGYIIKLEKFTYFKAYPNNSQISLLPNWLKIPEAAQQFAHDTTRLGLNSRLGNLCCLRFCDFAQNDDIGDFTHLCKIVLLDMFMLLIGSIEFYSYSYDTQMISYYEYEGVSIKSYIDLLKGSLW